MLFTGDLVFNGGTPFVVMGSVAGSLDSVEQLPRVRCDDGRARARLGLRARGVRSAHARTSSSCRASLGEGKAAGLSPLDAALQTDLGEFSEWHDRERIVGNLYRAYAELDGAERGARIDVVAALTDMVAYNGGQPLRCLA